MRKVFTTGQTAKICNVSSRTVVQWFDSGRLRGYRIPGSQDRRIPRENLIRFMKEHAMPLGILEEEDKLPVLIVTANKTVGVAVKLEIELKNSDSFRVQRCENGFEAGQSMATFNSHDDIVVVLDLDDRFRAQEVGIAILRMRGDDVYIIAVAKEDTNRSVFETAVGRVDHWCTDPGEIDSVILSLEERAHLHANG